MSCENVSDYFKVGVEKKLKYFIPEYSLPGVSKCYSS